MYYIYEGYGMMYDSVMYMWCIDDFGDSQVGVWPILDIPFEYYN